MCPLEEAISIYKQGMDLSRLCHSKLKSVEDQLTQILSEDGQLESFAAQRRNNDEYGILIMFSKEYKAVLKEKSLNM